MLGLTGLKIQNSNFNKINKSIKFEISQSFGKNCYSLKELENDGEKFRPEDPE